MLLRKQQPKNVLTATSGTSIAEKGISVADIRSMLRLLVKHDIKNSLKQVELFYEIP